MDAFRNALRELIIYLPCINVNTAQNHLPDYLATVDVNPESSTYSQVSYYSEEENCIELNRRFVRKKTKDKNVFYSCTNILHSLEPVKHRLLYVPKLKEHHNPYTDCCKHSAPRKSVLETLQSQ